MQNDDEKRRLRRVKKIDFSRRIMGAEFVLAIINLSAHPMSTWKVYKISEK